MAVSEKIISYQGMKLDLHESLVQGNVARFIKNLVYEITDTSSATTSKGAQSGVFKPLESIRTYIDGFKLPEGYNHAIGTFSFKDLKQVYAFIYNDQGNHTVYRLNGLNRTVDIVYQGPRLNFQLDPSYFIHTGGCTIRVIELTNPVTGEKVNRTFLMFSDAFNYQFQICVDDSIATNGFNPTLFPYFTGNYDPSILIRMGLPTPSDCISIKEIPLDVSSVQKNNNLLFNTWQFRIKYTDVWGRPSEHGIISDIYIPGVNDCINGSSYLPRCVELKVKIDLPIVDKVDIEYRNCNNSQWYIEETLDLYVGSNIGEWWKRPRNPKVTYDDQNKILTYTFCRDKECRIVDVNETNRYAGNPLSKKSVSVANVGKFTAIGNNTDGFNPFSQIIKDGIKAIVEPPVATTSNTATITIYCPIWNQYLKNFQSVRKGDENFPYIWGDNNSKHGGAVNYLQYFQNKSQSGFGGYLVGTKNLVYSTQVYVNANGALIDDLTFTGIDDSPSHMTYQKFVFTNIPKGKYIFRLCSHLTDPTINPSYEKTSTTVWSVLNYKSGDMSYAQMESVTQNVQDLQELLIDVCDKDYNTVNDNRVLMILDNAGYAHGQQNRAKCGYYYATDKNGYNEEPIELIQQSFSGGYGSRITDHNGFYYYATQANGRKFSMNFAYKCTKGSVGQEQGGGGGMAQEDIIIDKYFNSKYSDFTTTLCNRVLIKGKVLLPESNIGIGNATVVLTRGQTATTDAQGNFTLIAHDYVSTCLREDKLVFSVAGCNYTSQDGGCIPIQDVRIQCCVLCTERIITVKNILLVALNQRGLLSGGTYGYGVVGWDWLGRATFLQDCGYFTIPSITESKTIAPSKVRIDIDPSIVFPSEFAYITPFITDETTIQNYLDWIVDDVEFIDNTGLVNNANPSQIKIYYKSLLEYNTQNNFNTTTDWDFIPTGQNAPATADKVQFFVNGNGNYFDSPLTSLIKYDQSGEYFLIDYNDALKTIQKNSLMRLVRPKVCTGSEGYYEICNTVYLNNGHPQINSFYLNAFDTYYLNRSIPVPVTQPGSPQPTTINELRTFGFQFEHHSASNFGTWSYRCHNIGRINVKNPYETEIHHKDQIKLSGSISVTGQLNFLNYFDEAKATDFSDANINGIISILPELATILVIGQSNNFVTGFNDNLIRMNQDGTISATSVADAFGRPQGKIGGNYGCMLYDKNSIAKYQGMVMYLSSQESIVIRHDYQIGVPASNDAVDSYVVPKVKAIQNWNNSNTNKRYFTGQISPINNEYLLTDHKIGSSDYNNKLRYIDFNRNDTIAYDTLNKIWKCFYGFTPTAYGYCEGDVLDIQLFSFINGLPYYHHDAINEFEYGSIYGETVNRTLRFISSIDSMRKKKALSLSVVCKESRYFAEKVLTETNQESRILLDWFLQAEYGWFAPFLCSLNTPFDPNRPIQTGDNALLDGDMIVGNYVDVTMIGDPAKDDVYSELQGFMIAVFGESNNLITTSNG